MSFSKAKIQRFNEVKADCSPSPAKYNVLTQEKIKLGIISKPGTYSKKNGSPPGSDSASVHSTPCFQTPTLPVKKKRLLSFSKSSTKTLSQQEELREKIVECNNKDMYIKDLVQQIEEMTGKVNQLEQENSYLKEEMKGCEGVVIKLKKQQKENCFKLAREFKDLKNVNKELFQLRQKYQQLKDENVVELSKLLSYIDKFQDMYNKSLEENKQEFLCKIRELQATNEKMHEEHRKEVETLLRKLGDKEAKIILLEENFKEVTLLNDLQMSEKIQEVETTWKQKLEEKEKEHEAILKECQEISEYNIIQTEVEKNQVKRQLEEKEESYRDLEEQLKNLEEELAALKSEKHKYELSITTFNDTIEVLKKRLIDSDRDVVQLKEELESCEEKILAYEKKCTDLANELSETKTENEEKDMQFESTSKLMQSQVKIIENNLLRKVEKLENEAKKFTEVMAQYHEAQRVINEAEEVLRASNSTIDALESENIQLRDELKNCKLNLKEEAEDAAEIRKKYIEKSGKYDELAQQFEPLLQELDKAKQRIQELEEVLATHKNELAVITKQKCTIENEAKELSKKYAEILGHQNHHQKIKHLRDLKAKNSELIEKNVELETKNFKLNKLVEKLLRETEIEESNKVGKKLKQCEDKENLGSPKCLKGTQSPGPLKDKN